jgi:16S rRNA (uracil1498-N3)-methyltransferase
MTRLTDSSRQRAPRLFVDHGLAAGEAFALDQAQAIYLANVLRLNAGDIVLVFNGRDGEWRARIEPQGRKQLHLVAEAQARPQTFGRDLHYLFAPLKHARLDYMAQKATEMGVSRLVPVITRYTLAARVNLDRLHANAVEAAEQCGLLAIPEIAAPEPLAVAIGRLEASRTLVFCDEAPAKRAVEGSGVGVGAAIDPIAALSSVKPGSPLAVLIGPEGGFAEEERALVGACTGLVRLCLGPRILRADTAAVAALALVQSTAGDWRK